MVRWSPIGLAAAVMTVFMAATGSHAFAASTVKVSGSLTHAALPRPAAGVSLVQALNLTNGTLAATDYTDGRGRYSIKVPPGPYALVGGSVFFKAGQPSVKLLGAMRARAGKPRRLALSLRPKRRRSGRAAAASPIVGIPYFTGGAPYQSRGLATMVETDLVQLNAGPPCRFTVVEVQRRDDVIREIRLQQTEFFDPATRVQPGHLLQPQLLVKGTITPQAGGDLSYAINVVNARSGRVKGSTSGQIPESAFLTASQDIARELARILCDDTALYVGQVSGTLRVDSPPGCASDHTSFSYSATLGGFTGPNDPFAIISGTSGSVENDQGAKGYSEAGSGTYTLDPCADAQSQGCSNELHRLSGSYGQVLFERDASTIKATAYTFAWEGPGTGCSGNPSEQMFGEGTFPLSEVGADTITVTLSRHEDKGGTFDGSGTLTMHRVN